MGLSWLRSQGITTQKALKLFFAADSSAFGKSADRIRRVMNKGKNPFDQASTGEESEEKLISALIDPIFVLVRAVAGVSLVVALPTSFDTHEGKGLTSITEAALSAETTVAHAHVLKAMVQGADEDSIICSRQNTLGEALKAAGPFVRACSPSVVFESSTNPVWTLPLFSFSMLLELHYLDITGSQAPKMPKAEGSSIYRDAAGAAIFIATGTARSNGDDVSVTAATDAASDGEAVVTCPLCSLSFPSKLMHNHMGAHILLESDWTKWNKEKPEMPCGLCGERSAIMCSARIASGQVAGCPVSAENVRPPSGGVPTLKPVHQCKLLDGITYSLVGAAASERKKKKKRRPHSSHALLSGAHASLPTAEGMRVRISEPM